MRVVTGSRVTTQVWITVAPSRPSSCQPPRGSGVSRPAKRSLRTACAPSSRASAGISAAVGAMSKPNVVEVADLPELDHAGEFGIVGRVGVELGHFSSLEAGGSVLLWPKFLEFRPCRE